MEHFWDTVDTIGEGFGFTLFGSYHLGVLAGMVVLALVLTHFYRALGAAGRRHWRTVVAVLLLADELFKYFGLVVGDNFAPNYLPLHLCSINIFLIALHAWKRPRLLDSFLYFVCLPAACAALLFPTWTSLPALNFMHLHSFSIHLLLALYPLTLTVSGDMDPQPRAFPRCCLLLALMAVPIYFFNLRFGTNFMFLMWADEGNPLKLFERFGSHLLGYPVLCSLVFVVMLLLLRLRRKGRAVSAAH